MILVIIGREIRRLLSQSLPMPTEERAGEDSAGGSICKPGGLIRLAPSPGTSTFQNQGKICLCRLSQLGLAFVGQQFHSSFPDDLTENLSKLLWPSQHFVMVLELD